MRIAIYDMDGTLLRGSTFTPFLIFAAARIAPWRLPLLPAWIAMMVGHKAGLYDRATLKRRGMALMLGPVDAARLARVAEAFAAARLSRLHPGARQMIDTDRAEGWRQVIATAAYGLYADRVARKLDIADVIATQWSPDGELAANCYGPEKLARVKRWMGEQRIDRADVEVRFVSDSFADAPMLDWADEAWFVTDDPALTEKARARGWWVVDFSR
ncbi:MAG TPA: HAD-IB family phosphatase [Croceibacterium sp.]|nr:HAD-IB family phosphatase [Croceibacterium sp.]